MRALLALVLAAVPLAASAQAHPGSLRLSGGTGFASSSTSYSAEGQSDALTLKTRSAAAEGVYLLTPFVGVGASLQYTKTTASITGLEDSSDEAWTAGPMLALEYPLERAVLRAEAGWMWGHTSAAGSEAVKSSGWAIAGGVGFLLAPSLSVDLGVKYASMGAKFSGVDVTMDTFSASVGFSVYLGGAVVHAGGAGADTSGTRTTGAGNPSPW
ncbi:MAG: outer membrane beta-barrel protein [Anaeromyxobacteraceae bacterium]